MSIVEVSQEAQSMEEMRHALCGSVSGLIIPRQVPTMAWHMTFDGVLDPPDLVYHWR